MLDNHRFAAQQSEHERSESGTSQMNDVRRTHLLPQLTEARLAENAERKLGVVKTLRRRLRDEGDLEFRRVRLRVSPREASSDCEDNGFRPADTGSEIVRVQKYVHAKFTPGNRNQTRPDGTLHMRRLYFPTLYAATRYIPAYVVSSSDAIQCT